MVLRFRVGCVVDELPVKLKSGGGGVVVDSGPKGGRVVVVDEWLKIGNGLEKGLEVKDIFGLGKGPKLRGD